MLCLTIYVLVMTDGSAVTFGDKSTRQGDLPDLEGKKFAGPWAIPAAQRADNDSMEESPRVSWGSCIFERAPADLGRVHLQSANKHEIDNAKPANAAFDLVHQ